MSSAQPDSTDDPESFGVKVPLSEYLLVELGGLAAMPDARGALPEGSAQSDQRARKSAPSEERQTHKG